MNSEQRIDLLKSYIDEDPSDVFSRYALGLEYIKSGDSEKAFAVMHEINIHFPEYLPNYYHFGKLLESMGDISLAQTTYENGIQLAKKQADSHSMNELRSALDNLI